MIYHISEKQAWLAQLTSESYKPDAFDSEGFVHCSDFEQVSPTASRYYRGRDDLVVLEINPTLLIPETRYENLLGGLEKFPHVYGEINKSAIRQVMELGQFA